MNAFVLRTFDIRYLESLFIVRQFLRHCLYDYRMTNVNISHSVRLVSTRVEGLQ